MYEPQSLHWHHDQVSVQSQILKVDGEKSYNPYFFDSLRHDQVFVKQAMDEMVKDVDLKDDSKMIIIKLIIVLLSTSQHNNFKSYIFLG